ncbi:hypothetical protein SAMN05421578_1655 [Paenibacillus macquariensis]|uniref:Uncharacterized protein n=1 Tax=Paenibacillus macquariensis TaxID=948756 RepID=A0ABY1KFC2_9BACL|nr:hypothetical protein SAMN05421578_1655 [Paenibacillus macquariensis]
MKLCNLDNFQIIKVNYITGNIVIPLVSNAFRSIIHIKLLYNFVIFIKVYMQLNHKGSF